MPPVVRFAVRPTQNHTLRLNDTVAARSVAVCYVCMCVSCEHRADAYTPVTTHTHTHHTHIHDEHLKSSALSGLGHAQTRAFTRNVCQALSALHTTRKVGSLLPLLKPCSAPHTRRAYFAAARTTRIGMWCTKLYTHINTRSQHSHTITVSRTRHSNAHIAT